MLQITFLLLGLLRIQYWWRQTAFPLWFQIWVQTIVGAIKNLDSPSPWDFKLRYNINYKIKILSKHMNGLLYISSQNGPEHHCTPYEVPNSRQGFAGLSRYVFSSWCGKRHGLYFSINLSCVLKIVQHVTSFREKTTSCDVFSRLQVPS